LITAFIEMIGDTSAANHFQWFTAWLTAASMTLLGGFVCFTAIART
jgi:hypothetical protein